MNEKSLKALCLIGLMTLGGCFSNSTSSSLKNTSTSTNSSTTSTTSSTSSIDYVLDIESELAEFAKGLKLSTSMNDGMNAYHIQTAVKDNEFSFIQYEDIESEEKAIHEHYVSLDDEYIYATRLNANNEANYYRMINPVTGDYYKWSDGFENPFKTLTVDSFEKRNDNDYFLKEENIETASKTLTTLLYGNPGLELKSFRMYISNTGELNFSAVVTFKSGSTNYEFDFLATVIEKGENVKADARAVPFQEVNDATFEKIISDLKSNDYTAEIYNNDGFDEFTSYVYSNEDKIYYETGEYKCGFYVSGEGLVQEVVKDGDNFYKVGSEMEGSLDEIFPSFKLSRACFDLNEDGSYVLKDGIDGSMTSITFLETYADELDNFVITITENSYVFRNTYKDGTETTVKFTNIGTTDVGFTIDTVLEPKADVKWSEILDAESFAYLVSASNEEVADLIPIPEGYSTSVWIQFSEEEGSSMLCAEPVSNLDDDIFAYSLQLEAAGFIISDEEGENGGVQALMEIEVNGVEAILVVEFLEYEGMFCILTYCVFE